MPAAPEFKEGDHPRGEGGKFAQGSFGTSKKKNIAEAHRAIQAAGFPTQEWHKPGSASAAIYSNTDNKIHINSAHKFWTDPTSGMKATHAAGHLSSSDPSHVLNHEIGHAIYSPPDNWNTLSHQDMARNVSKYAAMNPKEFVSEVHAGMAGGKEFSPEIMQAFKMYARKRQGGDSKGAMDSANRWDLLVKALAAKPRAMDSKRGWIALAQDWAPECPKTKAMDAGDGWSAMCSQWGGGAAMDEQERDTSGRFGTGSSSGASEEERHANQREAFGYVPGNVTSKPSAKREADKPKKNNKVTNSLLKGWRG